jgi:23S rRNA (uracil1939-C5)-methyltransferase
MIGDQAVQIAERRQIVAGELRKALGWSEEQIDARLHMAAPAGGDLGYRQRIRLAWRRGPDGIRLGYRGRRSHEIIEIERCAVAAEPLNEALGDVRAVLADHGSREGEVTLLSGVHGVSWSLRGAGGVAAPGGVAEPVIHVQGRPLRVEASGFVQGNRAVTDAISAQVERVAREVAGHRALEFFAGVGTWTLALLEAGYTVEAYEGDGRAREAFLENTTHGEARFEVSDLLSLGVPEPPPQAADLLLLDPPRTGAAELMPWIRAIATPHVIFISCDVATGVRDLGALSGEGQPYDIDRITSYDMFPHTGHQELVIELSLRGSRC